VKIESKWLRYLRKNDDAKMTLFCFPYAGSGPGVYHAWLQDLAPSFEVVAIHYPGREARFAETPYVDLDVLVSELVNQIKYHLTRPFVFFGHSMGAYVAFLLSQRLAKTFGDKPEQLFISGARAPFIKENAPIHQLGSKAFLRAVIALNGISKEVLASPELVAMCLKALRADFTACENLKYKIEEELDIPLTLMGGDSDPRVSVSQLTAWGNLASRGVNKHIFSGDHFYLNEHRKTISRLINSTLT
jgi:medium-chain acyl-[acyl-carrier-protein] hydrolase